MLTEEELSALRRMAYEKDFMRQAADAHQVSNRERPDRLGMAPLGTHHCMIGANFVECELCHKHAHIAWIDGRCVLVEHDDIRIVRRIADPREF